MLITVSSNNYGDEYNILYNIQREFFCMQNFHKFVP